MSDAVVGTEVDGYRIESILGRGGMGTVYKAEDVNLSRTVAIKRINPGQQERESFIHRFRAEAQALARIDSSNIVGIYALRETDIGLLIVMEYVEGGTLKDPIDQQGALDPNQALPILEQALQAFDDAHSEGVIHRDIKPENVMLTTDGIVKVTDFGIAKLRQPDSGETVTQGGQGGTLKYMSPEQISDINAVDARSDIYSVGMTAYKVLAGTLPFKESDTDFDIMRKVVEGEIPPPDEFNATIPSGLAQWIMGAIEKEQEDRYQSAEEMLEALRDARQQSADHTMTQPEWEIDDGSTDVEQTQTVASEDEDQTQTVVPEDDGDEAVPSEPGGETVINPDPEREGGAATQPSVPDPSVESDDPETSEAETDGDGSDTVVSTPSPEPAEAPEPAATEESESTEATAEEDGSNWAAVGGGIVAVVMLLAIGGYVVTTQMGGGGGATASATLALTTTPAEATVIVNGDTAGTTPLNGHTLEAGAVQMQVQKEGFSPLDTTFTVEAGDQVALTGVTLARREADESTSQDAVAEQTTDPEADQEASGTSSADRQSQTAEPVSSTSSEQTAEAEVEEERTLPAPSSGSEEKSTSKEASSPAMGSIEVTPKPSGTLLVDGKEQRSTSTQVPVGEHTVACRHPEHGTMETNVAVAEGESEQLTCYFKQNVSVNTNGAFGRIWLNGTNTGKNTNAARPLSLPPGTHRIEVRRRSIEDFKVDGGVVKVTKGQESRTENFSGSTYELKVEPRFEKVKHAVVFNVKAP